jgi:cytoskeleton protein RodZ
MSDPTPVLSQSPDASAAPVTAPVVAVDSGPRHFGGTLRQAREAIGLSVDDIGQRLRLHARQIHALEAADLARLPALTYIKGFVRAYARELRIDPEPLLADLQSRAAPPAPLGAVNALSLEPSRRGLGHGARLVALGVVLVLVLAAAVGIWHKRQSALADAVPVAPAPASLTSPPLNAPDSPSAEAVAPPAPESMAAAPAPSAVAPVPAPVVSAPALSTPSAANRPAPATKTAGTAALQIRTRSAAWVQVRQANGQVVWQQTVVPGHEATLSAPRPLDVVVGNAAQVELTLNGQPMALGDYTNDKGVAHLHLP